MDLVGSWKMIHFLSKIEPSQKNNSGLKKKHNDDPTDPAFALERWSKAWSPGAGVEESLELPLARTLRRFCCLRHGC